MLHVPYNECNIVRAVVLGVDLLFHVSTSDFDCLRIGRNSNTTTTITGLYNFLAYYGELIHCV